MMPDEMMVVFTDQTDLWWLRHLRRGFRHCFILLRFGDTWFSVDALSHKTEIMRIDLPDHFKLVGWLESQGETVVTCRKFSETRKLLWPAAFTCVESVKRILGIHQPFIFTPWQLYQFIKERT